MEYGQSLEKAWGDLWNLTEEKSFSVKFLSDFYDIDTHNQTIFSASCNMPAQEHLAILILHYLIQKLRLKDLPCPSGEWINFNQLEGGLGYYSAFKKRTIDQIVRKYGANPDALLNLKEHFPIEKIDIGDVSIIIYTFEEVPLLITMSRADEEFDAGANIVFDKSISHIFCTEDIVVLTEAVVHLL